MSFVIDDIINAIGAHQAAQKQEDAVRRAKGVQTNEYNQQKDWQSPFYNAGTSSLADMMKMLQGGYDASQLANDPGYQFRMAEGQKALERSAAAKGGLASGGFMKGLDRYSQGLASDEFGNRFNRLAGVAGMGQHSADYLGNLSQNYANNMGQLEGAMGNAQSAGITGVTNGISGAVRSGANIGMMAAGMPGGMGGMFGGGGGGGAGMGLGSMAGGYGGGGGGLSSLFGGSGGAIPTQYGDYLTGGGRGRYG